MTEDVGLFCVCACAARTDPEHAGWTVTARWVYPRYLHTDRPGRKSETSTLRCSCCGALWVTRNAELVAALPDAEPPYLEKDF